MTIDGDNRAAPTEEMIAIRAYQKYIERGRQQGHDVEDWLAAEAEIRAELSEATAEIPGELSQTTAASAGPTRRTRPQAASAAKTTRS